MQSQLLSRGRSQLGERKLLPRKDQVLTRVQSFTLASQSVCTQKQDRKASIKAQPGSSERMLTLGTE